MGQTNEAMDRPRSHSRSPCLTAHCRRTRSRSPRRKIAETQDETCNAEKGEDKKSESTGQSGDDPVNAADVNFSKPRYLYKTVRVAFDQTEKRRVLWLNVIHVKKAGLAGASGC